jgi:hypothetical protein
VLPVERLLRETHAMLANTSVRMSPSKVTRLVRDYVNLVAPKGVPFGPGRTIDKLNLSIVALNCHSCK